MKKDRVATIDDLPDLLRIEQSAFPKERWASEDSLRRRMTLYPGGSWLALLNGDVAAFSNGFPITDRSTQADLDPADHLLFDSSGPVWLLRNVAVHQAFQRRGLGRLLINRQLELARSYGAKCFRFTATTNLNAYYSALGFSMLKEPVSFHGLPQGVWNLDLG
jgi:GNAT superfamily N-acetyltransferase